jgi:hypothetical protein
VTGANLRAGEAARAQAGSAALLPSVVAALGEAGLTVQEYARQHDYADGEWFGDRCGCPDDRCIGFHHFGQDDCGCFPVVLDLALNGQAEQAGLSVEEGRTFLGQAAAAALPGWDEQRSREVWQVSDELSAQATAGAGEDAGLAGPQSALGLGEAGAEAGL